MKLFLSAVMSVIFFTSNCVSPNNEAKNTPPISMETSIDEMIALSISYGEAYIPKTRKFLLRRNQVQKADEILSRLIIKNYETWGTKELLNASQLYSQIGSKNATKVFEQLIFSERKIVQKVAWTVASSFPSKKMGEVVDQHLTDAIAYDDMDKLFLPEMANAISRNELVMSYSLVREGLFKTNDIAFAKALIHLDSKRSSYDFMNYLAKAEIEELRQLHITSVDMFVCVEIMKHFLNYELNVAHPNIKHLFYYAISRNQGLSDMALRVLDKYIPQNTALLATTLSQTQTWVQLAYIEKTRTRLTPIKKLLLSELQDVSSHYEIIDEVKGILR